MHVIEKRNFWKGALFIEQDGEELRVDSSKEGRKEGNMGDFLVDSEIKEGKEMGHMGWSNPSSNFQIPIQGF